MIYNRYRVEEEGIFLYVCVYIYGWLMVLYIIISRNCFVIEYKQTYFMKVTFFFFINFDSLLQQRNEKKIKSVKKMIAFRRIVKLLKRLFFFPV